MRKERHGIIKKKVKSHGVELDKEFEKLYNYIINHKQSIEEDRVLIDKYYHIEAKKRGFIPHIVDDKEI